MASTKLSVTLLALVAVSLMLTSGCFMLEGNIKLNVDGSANVEMRVAISEALAQMGDDEGDDPFAQMKENLPEGDWTVEDITEDGWRGVALKGVAPPGGKLFPETEAGAEAPEFNVDIQPRLFSTDYTVQGTFSMQEPEAEEAVDPDAEAQTGQIIFCQAEEEEEEMDPEALMGLFGAMGQQMRVSFSVTAPGTILETSGEQTGSGTAEWGLDMASLMQSEAPQEIRVYLRSRLLNQQSIGRLADKLAAERDLPEMSALIAEYVARGLLPNPPKKSPLKAGLDAAAYDHALGVLVILEDVLGEATAARVVRGLKLNADNVTAKELREMHELVMGMEEDELVEVGAGAVLKHLKMLSD